MPRRLHVGARAYFSSVPNLNFVVGTAGSANLANFVTNPRNATATYAVSSGSLPPGCSLSGSIVSWTGSGNEGITNVVFSVSQFSRSNVSPQAAVTVSPQVNQATFTWTPPFLNDDGSPLVDLAGYRVYGSVNSGPFNMLQQVADPGATGTVVTGLTSGSWVFHVRAYDTEGFESVPSNTGSKVIP